MSDWRLELNGHMVEDLAGATFYKVTFPEFWEVAYREKNAFYQKIATYAKSHVESTNKGHEFLEGERIQHFWHEHCELCYEKAMTDIHVTFYCTEDLKCWICEECFNDFREKFNWQEESAEELYSKISINEIEKIIKSDNYDDCTVYMKLNALRRIEEMRKGKNIKCPKCDKGVISAEGDPKTTKIFRCNGCKTAMILTVPYKKSDCK